MLNDHEAIARGVIQVPPTLSRRRTLHASALGLVYCKVMGKNFPAMVCVQVAGLMGERAKIEIEVTAVIPD